MELNKTNPLAGTVGARRSGNELASLVPKRVCTSTGTIEHWRTDEPGSPHGDLTCSPCSEEVFSITGGYDTGTETRTTPLCKAPDPICIFSGPVRYQPDPTTNKHVITCAEVPQLCGSCPVPHDQPLITDCFQLIDLDTVDIRTASTDELTWILHMRFVNHHGGWQSTSFNRAVRKRAKQLKIGIWA